MWEYLQGDYDHEEMIFRGICATRQLAKRQLTLAARLENTNTMAR